MIAGYLSGLGELFVLRLLPLRALRNLRRMVRGDLEERTSGLEALGWGGVGLLDEDMVGTHRVGLCLALLPICWMVPGSALLGPYNSLLLQVGGPPSIRGLST